MYTINAGLKFFQLNFIIIDTAYMLCPPPIPPRPHPHLSSCHKQYCYNFEQVRKNLARIGKSKHYFDAWTLVSVCRCGSTSTLSVNPPPSPSLPFVIFIMLQQTLNFDTQWFIDIGDCECLPPES